MALYELSIDANLIREAEKVVSLEGRGFPTLVMRWESRLFDQPWVTTIVLDYTLALPPLMIGQSTFNEVKIGAFVGGAPTKFLYFGTEMSSTVPRLAPEMENSVTPASDYQEYRLEEQTCPIPYLKLIQTTPRIYGNAAQDYYSPPIKVERYDGQVGPDLLADYFSPTVANLEPVSGAMLTDSARGFWTGGRFVGATKIAILRQGKVVGLHQRMGRTDRDPVPAEIKKRDPKLDALREWVAVDIGANATTIALRGERNSVAEFVRVGAGLPAEVPADFETPSEIAFVNLARFMKAWRERVILPVTRWEDLQVGFAARDMRLRPGDDQPDRRAASLPNVSLLRERVERAEPYRLRGKDDLDTLEMLKRPAPPIIDEEGIGAHDAFDPIELFAYYVGVHVNHRLRGVHLRYAVTMPTGWSPERRQSVLIAFRRGFFRSLPVGLVEYHDLERFEVIDAGPATIPFSVHAFRVFNIQPRNEAVVFATIDAGASETSFLFGHLRQSKPDEKSNGFDRMIEHIEPVTLPWLGAERLLHRLAFRLWAANEPAMMEAKIPIEPPLEETPADAGEELNNSPEARANKQILKDLIRPIFEGRDAVLKPTIRLVSSDRRPTDVPIEVDVDAIKAAVQGWIDEGVTTFKESLTKALERIGKGPDPFDGVRVLLGGRFSMHPRWGDELTRVLPLNLQVHRFREPDKTNIQAPTVKTTTVLGVLGMRWDRTGATLRAEKRETFRYRVGRARHGQLTDVLDPTIEYDLWREMGPCLRADVDVLFMVADDDGEIAADDPRVSRATCSLGASAVGQRVYLRAVAPARVEVSVGPPGEEPERGAPTWVVELASGVAHPA